MNKLLDDLFELTGVRFGSIERHDSLNGRRVFLFRFSNGGQRLVPVWQCRSASNLNWLLAQFRQHQDVTGEFPLLTSADSRTFTRLAHEAADLLEIPNAV